MIKFPYGISSFSKIREENFLYMDRTSYIRTLEEMGDSLLFIRPRRFGKSLWLNTLRCYYDVALANRFDALFGDLAIGSDPTLLHNKYFVLEWDFSGIDPRGSVDDIARRLNEYVNADIEDFLTRYTDYFEKPIKREAEAINTLRHLLSAIQKTPFQLYLLIDEYDNFANEVMFTDEKTYKSLVHKDGPLKTLFKAVKEFMKTRRIDRLFLTGVSPVVMSDITSGLNICENIYLRSRFNALCGLTKEEVRGILEQIVKDCSHPALTADGALEMMRMWYDGYRFSVDAAERVYNPTLAFYFLKYFAKECKYPRQMLDSNLAADEGKLEYLGQAATGRQAVVDVLQTGKCVEVDSLIDRFTLSDMLDRAGQDNTFLASYLYYFGMLTLTGETEQRTLLLAPPNMVTKKLYADRILRFLLPAGTDRNEATEAVRHLTRDSNINQLLQFVEKKLFPIFSNRDYLWMNEFAIKTAFTTLLFNDVNYAIYSEPELSRGYADLCLILRPDARPYRLHDLLFEFKYLELKKIGLKGEDVRKMNENELRALTPVVKAFSEARTQLVRYEKALQNQFGQKLKLRSYIVVAVGFERLLVP